MGILSDWLTTQEAAEMAGYHPDYIQKLAKAGEIAGRKWGNSWMINRESLVQYLSRMEERGGKRGPKPNSLIEKNPEDVL